MHCVRVNLQWLVVCYRRGQITGSYRVFVGVWTGEGESLNVDPGDGQVMFSMAFSGWELGAYCGVAVSWLGGPCRIRLCQ